MLPMKLRAVDGEDLQILSACLQDAIVPIADICYLPNERRFVLVANRFKWETADQPRGNGYGPSADVEDAPFERTNCGLTIDGVTNVRRRNINTRDRSQLLSLLAIVPEPDGLKLIFASGGCIHLVSDRWICWLQDVGEPWPCRCRPEHSVDDAVPVAALA